MKSDKVYETLQTQETIESWITPREEHLHHEYMTSLDPKFKFKVTVEYPGGYRRFDWVETIGQAIDLQNKYHPSTRQES